MEDGAQEKQLPSPSKDHASQRDTHPPEVPELVSRPIPAMRTFRMPDIADMVERFSMQSVEHSSRGTFLHHDALPSPPSSEDSPMATLYRAHYFMTRNNGAHYHDHHDPQQQHHHHHQHNHHDGTYLHSEQAGPILDREGFSRPSTSSADSSRLFYPTSSCRRAQRQLESQLQQDGASIREIRSKVSEIVHSRRCSVHRGPYSYARSRSRSRLSSTSMANPTGAPTPTLTPPQQAEHLTQNKDLQAKEILTHDIDDDELHPETMEIDPDNRDPSPDPFLPFPFPSDEGLPELHEWDANPMPFSLDEETMRLQTFLGPQSSNGDDDPEFGLGLKRSTVPAGIRKYAIRYRGCAECMGSASEKVRRLPRMRRRRLDQQRQVRRMSSLAEVAGD